MPLSSRTANLAALIGRVHTLIAPAETEAPKWCLAELRGRLSELSGQDGAAVLTLVFGLVLDAQMEGEPVAWIGLSSSSFFPPDVAEGGIDLATLLVVRAPEDRVARAADLLARSGAFGLLVLDLGRHASIPMPLQSRLLGLAQKHGTALVCLTEKPIHAPSLSSLVSLRAIGERRRCKGGFVCSLHVLKDKHRGPGWIHEERCNGPAGLC